MLYHIASLLYPPCELYMCIEMIGEPGEEARSYDFRLQYIVMLCSNITQSHGLFKARQFKSPYKIGTAERKILIVFVYYVLLAAISLVAFSLSTRHSEQFIIKVLDYFTCESHGVNPDNHCDEKINSYLKHRHVALLTLSHVLLGLYPVMNLIYVINTRELKLHVKKWLLCRRSSYRIE